MTTDGLSEIKRIISSMTPEEKVGQVAIPMLQSSTLPEELVSVIKKHGVGFVRYCPNADFDNNSKPVTINKNLSPAQTAELLNSLQTHAKASGFGVPIIVTTDQEGGARSDINRGGMTIFPNHMGLGAINDARLTSQAAAVTARELRSLGIHLIQSPILDVETSTVPMTTAPFADSSSIVSWLGAAMIKGYKSEGMACMAKHFPGYGSLATDPHRGMAKIKKSREELEKNDIEPYKDAFIVGLDGIMMGHVIASALDPDTPASLSEKIIKGYLRKELKFDGIIQTDALRMKAIEDAYGAQKAAVLAVKAGCDSVLLRGDYTYYEQCYQAILQAVTSGEIDQQQLNDSVFRILRLKLNLGLFENPFADPKKAEETAGKTVHKELARYVSMRSVTLVRNRKHTIPLKIDASAQLLVVTAEPRKLAAAQDPVQSVDMLNRAIKTIHPQTTAQLVSIKPTAEQIQKAVAAAKTSTAVIAGTANASINKEQAVMVRKLHAAGKPLIVVAMESPHDIKEFPEVDTYLCSYGASNESIAVTSEIIFGIIKAVGKAPVKLPD